MVSVRKVLDLISGLYFVMSVMTGFTSAVLELVLRNTGNIHHRIHFSGFALCVC